MMGQTLEGPTLTCMGLCRKHRAVVRYLLSTVVSWTCSQSAPGWLSPYHDIDDDDTERGASSEQTCTFPRSLQACLH